MYKIVWVIIFVFGALSAEAQNNKLRKFLNKPQITCAQIYDSTLTEIITLKPENRLDSADALLEYWFTYCDATTDMIALQLLADVANYRPIPEDSELLSFYRAYLQNLKYKDYYQRNAYFKFVNNWAQELYTQRDWPRQEGFLLELLSKNKSTEAREVVFKKKYYGLAVTDKLRIEDKASGFSPSLELGFGTWSYQNELSRYLSPSPALHFGLGAIINKRSAVHVIFQVGFPQYRQDLKFLAGDTVNFSRGSYAFNVGFAYNYALWQNNRWQLNTIASVAYEAFDTGITETEIVNNNEERSDLTISTVNVGLGLDLRYRVYLSKYISLRTTYHLINYNAGNTALNNLNGGYFNFMVLYHF